MARMTRELKAKGIDIIGLSLGEPDFDTPDFIKEAANQAIADNYSHYTPVNGLQSLREAISMKFKRDNNLDYSADQIVVSTGAKQSIANVVLSLVNEGDEVLLPAPYWVSYSEIVKVAGGIPVIIETSIEDDFKITPALLEKNINERTTMMIYSSPCNPSGSVYTGEELAALSAVIEKHEQLYVISDEIYELINYQSEHASLAQNKAIYDRVITINGVSKGFAMTGWRLGYIGAPKWIADACNKIQGQFTSAPCAVAQKAAEAAVLADPSEVRYMIDAFKKRRDFVLARLAAMPGVKINTPEGAFYAFPDIAELYGKSWSGGAINDSSDFAMYLLEEAHVAVVAGEAFGDPNGIRISYAASMEDLEKAMDRIENAIKALA
ncbi:MAG: pyridoxal phosphate-dependent aminotransferase [Flavobacteriales bacterium]|nr:pyridoxal phosphate-dependent aminotransferase [Flavobacteriales bacterium]